MSFSLGKDGEERWATYLMERGLSVQMSPNKRIHYDMIADGDKYEVKTDRKAYKWAERRKTPGKPNLYMEFKNTNKDESAGIIAALEEGVLYFIYILITPEDEMVAHCFHLPKLVLHCGSANYKEAGNKQYGDDNALGWLVPLHEVENNGDAGYLKSVNLGKV